MIFQNILVPYDGSKHSIRAFKVALDIAKKYNAKIKVVTCLETDFRAPFFVDSRVDNSVMRKHVDATKKHFAKLEKNAKKEEIVFSSKILQTSSIVKTLISFAKSSNASLIIMGSHGRTGFDKMLLGSVVNGVSQKVNCPVLIIK